MMKSVGMTRPVDSLGRIVIPKELRKNMNIQEDVDRLEIFTNGDYIMLRKYQPGCILCGWIGETVELHGKQVCPDCIARLNSMAKRPA